MPGRSALAFTIRVRSPTPGSGLMPASAQLRELMQTARAAKSAGQTNRWQELAAVLRQRQDEMHREVFSTAPANEALAGIRERIPEIEKQAGVTMLVSKWDVATIQKYSHAEPMDLTDRLVREFQPAEQHLKVIADLQKQKPLRWTNAMN